MITMRKRMKRGLLFSILLSCLVFACKNPLSIGLGDKVDLDVPEISILAPLNGAYVKGTVIVEGTYADDIAVAAVKISLDGGVSFQNAALSAADKHWDYDFDTSGHADGEQELIIQVVDGSGKTIEKRLLLFIDNQPPIAMITQPWDTPGTYNGEFSIKGEAADEYGIDRVEVRIYDDATGIQVIGLPTQAQGTVSWSYLLDSSLLPGDGDYRIEVIAFDKSDNPTGHVYHYKDIYEAHDETVTIDQLYQIEQLPGAGDTIAGISLTQGELTALQQPCEIVTIDQNSDIPIFLISTPEPGDVLGSNAKAIGMVTDDDGVLAASIQISIDGGAWTDVTPSGGDGLAVNWQHDMGITSGGAHDVKIRARDIYNPTLYESATIPFSVDLGAPTVEVTSPLQGSYQNGNFLISGTAFDSEGVSLVEVSTDGGSDYYAATDTGGGYSTWTYTASVPGDGLTDGSRTIKIKAEDTSAKVGYTNLQVVIDTQDPSLFFLTPANSATVNGEVLIKGTSSDNTQVSKVELKIGSNDPWFEPGGTYNWEYTIDSASYANGTHALDMGGGVWKLNIQARATDAAGNITMVSDHYIFIDNDMDKPTVGIIAPADGQNIGGSTLVTGTAFDDDAVYRVEMQIDLNNDGDFLDQIDLTPGGDGDFLDMFENESLWYPVSGTTLWTQELNAGGELYETEPGHDGTITLRVRAVDTKDGFTPDVTGNYQELNVHFDDTIPRVENLSHGSGDYVSGVFLLTGDVLDDVQVQSISLSYDGGVSYTDITADGAKVTQNTPADYDLHVSIDSAAHIATSGILYLRVKVVDNANFQKLNYINLNVDNVFPGGAYTGDASDIHGSGLFSRVQGTATDSGTVSGIDRIEVYFVRGGLVYNPLTGETTTVGAKDFEDGSGSVPYTTDAAYKINIDNIYEQGLGDSGGNGDGDGFNESLTVAGSTYNWWAEFDSTKIPDGTIDIRYVVFDHAGNGKPYLEPGFIKNNKPTITSLWVGSDVDMSGTVEGIPGPPPENRDEQFLYEVPFSARNRLYIEINAADNAGGLAYAVYHDPNGDNTLVLSAAVGTIDISGYAEGPTDFLCRVTDNDGIVVETTIDVTIDNDDTQAPEIIIYDLTDNDAPDGHIELQGESNYDGPDPDLSGTVTLKGEASDNQRIASITVQIAGFDAGSGSGAVHEVAVWSGGLLASTDGSFVITDQKLTESGGHEIDWTYTWDTSGVNNSAQANVNVEFTVSDFAVAVNPTPPPPTLPLTASAQAVYDVVPYISSLSTQSGGIKDENIRSVSGDYSIRQNLVDAADLITISGYNLRPIAGGVRVSSDTDGLDDLDGITPEGTALTVESTGSPYTQLTVRKNADRSGYLAVLAGTAGAPVPSLNNVNDNSRTYNQEPDIYSKNDLLTDDRYLTFFTVADTGYNNGYYPAMIWDSSGNTPVFAYCDDNSGQTRRNGSNIGGGWYHRMTALAADGDGNLFQVSVHDAFGNGRYGHLTLFYNGWGGNVYPAAVPGSTADNNNALALDNLSTPGGIKLNRYHYPRLIASGDSSKAQVYLLYYDDHPSIQDLIFRTFQVGTSVDGTVRRDLAGAVQTNQTEATGDNTTGGRNTVAGSASIYFDMGRVADGTIVIVYYDEAANTLKLIYNNSPVGADGLYAGSFSAPLTLDSSYNGAHVSLAVDGGNHIHIAYYDSASADLKYIYLDSYMDTTPDAARVDAYHSVGLWTDIEVTSAGVPYIAYYNNSENGTGDSIKLTYYLGTLPTVLDGVDGSNNITGNWECLTVPVRDVPRGGLPQFNRVNLEFNNSNQPVLGFLADDIEYSTRLPEIP